MQTMAKSAILHIRIDPMLKQATDTVAQRVYGNDRSTTQYVSRLLLATPDVRAEYERIKYEQGTQL